LSGDGWTVDRPATAPPEGWTDHLTGTIRIGPDPGTAAAVLLHEAGHAVPHADLEPGECQSTGAPGRPSAESVAYVVAALRGLDTTTMSCCSACCSRSAIHSRRWQAWCVDRRRRRRPIAPTEELSCGRRDTVRDAKESQLLMETVVDEVRRVACGAW
jgi:hypothetical protein